MWSPQFLLISRIPFRIKASPCFVLDSILRALLRPDLFSAIHLLGMNIIQENTRQAIHYRMKTLKITVSMSSYTTQPLHVLLGLFLAKEESV